MSQVRGLRSRIFIKYIHDNPRSGAYFQIGNTVKRIMEVAKLTPSGEMINSSLSDIDSKIVSNFPTTLRRVTESEFDLILRHGFEVADATIHGFLNGKYLVYQNV